MDDLEDSKLNQDLRGGNPTTGQSSEEVSSVVQPGEDLFQLQTELSDAFEPPPIQRTSTPTDDKELLFTHFDLGEASEKGLAPNKEAEGSLVLDAEGNTNEGASINHKTLVSSGEVSNENSLEASHSLYASALSNINDTKTSNRYSLRGNSETQSNELSSSALQETIHVESWSESVTQDSAWATACGSEQDFSESDVKDTTVTGQELESRNEPIELKDDPVTYYDSMEKSLTESEQGDESHELTYNTSENGLHVDHQLEEDCSNLKIMDAEEGSVSQTPPDLDLLNEICEEATNMTIKEALICSLKPGVRAGLSEGRLLLSESEVMALEQYCEHFIDNLFSELLDGQWMEAVDEEAGSHDPVDDKAVIARKLSDISLDTLKANCDRFVHSIITESIHNSCFGSELKDVNPHETSEVSPNKPEQGALDKNSVKDVLPLFQGSESIQQYIGLLTADLIKSALANLSSPAATGNVEKNVPLLFNENNASCEKTSMEVLSCLSEDMGEIQNQTANNDSTKSDRDDSPNVAFVNKSNSVHLIENGEDDIDELCMEDTAELSEEEEILSGSFTCALETSLEFDIHDDWEGGDLQFESLLPEAETKQKIMLRELSFDEHADIAGTELLAPVFLAIAEENDDDSEFQGMRKKAQSIENLCGIIEEQAVEEPRQRSFSAPKKISLTQPMPDVLSEVSQTDEEEIDVYESDSGDGNGSEVEKEEEETREEAASPDEGSNGDRFRWHTVSVNRRDKVLDLKLLEPYMKVISHGGYFSDTKATIVVIAACYLPDKTIKNYKFLMEQLFFYVVSTLELLAIHEDYYLVYLNGGTRQQNMPTVAWMKRFYQHIEGGLKKRMKEMFIVHPNFWLKTVIRLSKPFINLNFWRKLSFVQSLQSLNSVVPIDYIYIPDEVMRVDPAYRVAHNR